MVEEIPRQRFTIYVLMEIKDVVGSVSSNLKHFFP